MQAGTTASAIAFRITATTNSRLPAAAQIGINHLERGGTDSAWIEPADSMRRLRHALIAQRMPAMARLNAIKTMSATSAPFCRNSGEVGDAAGLSQPWVATV